MKRLGFSFSLAVVWIAFVHPARAELPEWLGGKALVDQYEGIGPGRDARGNGNETLQSSFTLVGEAAPKFSDAYSGRAILRATAFRRSLEDGRDFKFRGDVQELWIERSASGLSVKVGEIRTPWGRSDAVNPTDFLTARDLTFLSTVEDLRREGAPGARLTFVPDAGTSPVELTLAWNARYPQTKMLIPSRGVPSGLTVETDPAAPGFLGDSQEWALKIAYLASSFDASIIGFRGRNHFGQFVWTGREVKLSFERERALGADFSVTFDDFVLRGESAYFFYEGGRRGRGDSALTQPDHWDSVLGIERAFGPRFRMILQAVYRVHPALADPGAYVGSGPIDTAVQRGVGQANALIQNYQEKSEAGLTLLGTYTSPEEDWRIELGALGNFVGGGDFVVRPKVSHKIRDSLHVAFGMDYYGGPTGKTLGALRDYRSAFLEGSLDF